MHLTNLVSVQFWHSSMHLANTLFLLKVNEFMANSIAQEETMRFA